MSAPINVKARKRQITFFSCSYRWRVYFSIKRVMTAKVAWDPQQLSLWIPSATHNSFPSGSLAACPMDPQQFSYGPLALQPMDPQQLFWAPKGPLGLLYHVYYGNRGHSEGWVPVMEEERAV